jgi:Domain of unknown function (DUF4383)
MEARRPPEDDPRTTAGEPAPGSAEERTTGTRREAVRDRDRGDLEAAHRAGVREGAARTLAQSFCLALGLVLIAAGVLGLIFGNSSFDTGDSIQGGDFLGFTVNGWHNVVHIATGAFLVLMAGSAGSAALGALIFGIIYAAVCVVGFTSDSDIFNVVAIDDADNWLHLGLAVLGIIVGLSAGGLKLSAGRERRRIGLG